MPNGEQHNTDQISIPTPWGRPLVARGSLVIILIMILAGGYFTFMLNDQLRREHESIMELVRYQACLTRLNLYVATSKDPTVLNFRELPAELWNCLPRFITDDMRKKGG